MVIDVVYSHCFLYNTVFQLGHQSNLSKSKINDYLWFSVTCDNPLYIRPHCKTVLTLAISNDSQFLADQSVMDYSLLVGLDEDKGELVVGIIGNIFFPFFSS